MDNNIFQYATSELSQDAIICWCANWLNYRKSELHGLAEDFIKLVYPGYDNKTDDEVAIIQQLYKIDILLYLKKAEIAVIIEDKIYSSEHGNQIAVYKEALSKIPDNVKKGKEIGNISKIVTTYFKTGFYYDDDKIVKADYYVTGPDFLNMLKPYREKHPILAYYYEHLDNLIRWYDIHGEINDTSKDSFWSWNIAKHQIAQYNMMRYIFPEDKWKKPSNLYKVRHGTNRSGWPWTEMTIYEGAFADKRRHKIFWRIDTDKQGSYLALRFYDGELKKEDEQMMRDHQEKYERLRNVSRELFGRCIGYSWETVKYRYTGRSKETTLFRIPLDKKLLQSWESQKEDFRTEIIRINGLFLDGLEEIQWAKM